MITKIRICNFRCFKDFEADLGPFNVLIGPNDSGKTAFLQAVQLCSVVGLTSGTNKDHLRSNGLCIGEHFVWRGSEPESLRVGAWVRTGDKSLDGRAGIVFYNKSQVFAGGVFSAGETVALVSLSPPPNPAWFSKAIGKAHYFHLDPGALRAPSPIMSPGTLVGTGAGFPTFLEDFLRKDRNGFREMENEFYARFPQYDSIDIPKIQQNNGLTFRTRQGQILDAQDVSDGVMLCLAFLAITHHPEPPNILLIEEPENGVHYLSLKETVQTLKHLCATKGVQVILTTHSPYLLDLVEPDEVQVFTKDEEGAVHAKKLADYPDVAMMKKHFMTGEIWTMLAETAKI